MKLLWLSLLLPLLLLLGVMDSPASAAPAADAPPSNATTSDEPLPVASQLTDECAGMECGYGTCVMISGYPECSCMSPYITTPDAESDCLYKAKSKLVAFLLSLFLGELGIDWFYLSGGGAGYIVGGIFKMITFGGFGLWWLIDWIRILADGFADGQGFELYADM